jgi:hypothetical protein
VEGEVGVGLQVGEPATGEVGHPADEDVAVDVVEDDLDPAGLGRLGALGRDVDDAAGGEGELLEPSPWESLE